MASCECCWDARGNYDGAYSDEIKRHEDMSCVCTKDSTEGKKARAGQFWENGCDRRDP